MAILVNNKLVKVFFQIDLSVLHASLVSWKLNFETFDFESW